MCVSNAFRTDILTINCPVCWSVLVELAIFKLVVVFGCVVSLYESIVNIIPTKVKKNPNTNNAYLKLVANENRPILIFPSSSRSALKFKHGQVSL